jgi:hypothetical protein
VMGDREAAGLPAALQGASLAGRRLACRQVCRLLHWLAGRPAGCFTGLQAGLQAASLACRQACRLLHWLAGSVAALHAAALPRASACSRASAESKRKR